MNIPFSNKDELVMKLVHYFVTKENYAPILVNGVQNEVWLENLDNYYKIIRINSNYIHNIEQYKLDMFKINNVRKQISKKTLSRKMKVLNIFIDINEEIKIVDGKDIDNLIIRDDEDLHDKKVQELFPNKYYIKSGEIYRLLTCGFLHADIIHLLCNMYSLNIIGTQLENFIGKKKFLIVYFVSMITGSLLSCVMSNNWSVGASGAIFGLLGSLLYFGYHYRIYLGSVMKSQIIPIIILNLGIGFIIPNIDVSAHVGGLVGGLLSTMIVGIENKSNKTDRINGTICLLILVCFLCFILFK